MTLITVQFSSTKQSAEKDGLMPSDIEQMRKSSVTPSWSRSMIIANGGEPFHHPKPQWDSQIQVLNQRAALLSNYEVLTWLRELESDHLARTKTAHRVKKEEEASSGNPISSTGNLEATENLRTVQVEVSKGHSGNSCHYISEMSLKLIEATTSLVRVFICRR